MMLERPKAPGTLYKSLPHRRELTLAAENFSKKGQGCSSIEVCHIQHVQLKFRLGATGARTYS